MGGWGLVLPAPAALSLFLLRGGTGGAAWAQAPRALRRNCRKPERGQNAFLNPPGTAAGGDPAEGGGGREPQSTWLARGGGGGNGIIRPVPRTNPALLRAVPRRGVKLLGFAVDVAK